MLLSFSHSLFKFCKKLELEMREILSSETEFEVRTKRFLFNNYLYPIHIVTFESSTKLGFFNPENYQIGINQDLIFEKDQERITEILKHEIAHYLCFLIYPNHKNPHGEEFKNICDKYNWGENIKRATEVFDINQDHVTLEIKHKKVLEKIKNLLNLASSSNTHEAELATIKANELLYRYNIENFKAQDDEKTYYIDRLLFAKRRNSKIEAIYEILTHFLVKPILSYTTKGVYLEAGGTKENLELARYIASFLDSKLDELWNVTKKNNPELKGLRDKNQFFLGLAQGYSRKMNTIKTNFKDEKSLVLITNELETNLKFYYRGLRSESSQSSFSQKAFTLGNEAGNKLSINTAIKGKNSIGLLK